MTKQIITAILFIFIHCWILKAEVTIKDILTNKKENTLTSAQLDLLLGRLWIESGFLPKFRKYCNVEYKVEDSKRSYHKDKGKDGVAELAVKLFPGYTTGDAINTTDDFKDKPKDLIDLFLFCQTYETLRTNPNEIINKLIDKMKKDLDKIENDLKSATDWNDLQKSWEDKYNGVGINLNFDKIKEEEETYNSSNTFEKLAGFFKTKGTISKKEIYKNKEEFEKCSTIWKLMEAACEIIQRKNLEKLENEVAKRAALFLVNNDGNLLNKDKKDISIQGNFKMVAKAIDDEQKHGYAIYTVKNMILAAISKVLEPKKTEEKAAPKTKKTLNDFYDDYDSHRNSLPETLLKDTAISDGVKAAVPIIGENFSANNGWVTYSNPYQNRRANYVKINSGTNELESAEGGTFADCHEAAIRHIFNSVLGSEKINDIDNTIKEISKRVSESTKNRLEEMAKFYIGVKGQHNSDSTKDCTAWNKVVSNLNNITSSTEKVVYMCDLGNYSQNELSTGFKNMAKVMARVIGYEMPKITKDNLVEQLKIIFRLINDKCEYECEDRSDKGNASDFFGDLNVKVSKEGKIIHEFKISQQPGHAYVTFPESEMADMMQQKLDYLLRESRNPQELKELKDLFGCLLRISGKSDDYLATINFFYLLLPYNSENAILDEVPLEQLKNIKDGTVKNTAETILKNSLLQRSELVIPVEVTLDGALLECKPSEFSELKQLTIDGTIEGDLTLPSSLKKVSINYNGKIKGNLNLSDCSNLTEAELCGTICGNLTLPKVANKLEKLSVDDEKVWQSISKYTNLTDLWIRGDINEDLTLPSSLKKLEVTGIIKGTLNLSKNSNLTEVRFYKTIDGKKLILPKELQILFVSDIGDGLNLSECANLKNLTIGGNINKDFIFPPSLEKVTISCYGKINGDLDLSKCTNLTEVKLDGTIDKELILPKDNLKILSIYNIKNDLNLSECTNLTDLMIKGYINKGLTLPPSLNKVTIWLNGKINGNLDLSACTNLTEAELGGIIDGNLILPKELQTLFVSNVKGVQNLFKCTNLTDLTINGEIGEDLNLPTSLNKVTMSRGSKINGDLDLSRCINLTEAELSGTIKKNLTLPQGNNNLRKLSIDNIKGELDLSKYTNLIEAKYGTIDGNLTITNKSNKLKKLDVVNVKGNMNLSECTTLINLTISGKIYESLTLPSSLNKVTISRGSKIKRLDLSKCVNLTDAELDGTINGKLILPQEHNDLRKLIVRKIKGVQNLTECTNLINLEINGEIGEGLTLPPSLEKVTLWQDGEINGKLDLSGCANLTKVELRGTISEKLTLPNKADKLKRLCIENIKGDLDLSKYTNLEELVLNGEIRILTLPPKSDKLKRAIKNGTRIKY